MRRTAGWVIAALAALPLPGQQAPAPVQLQTPSVSEPVQAAAGNIPGSSAQDVLAPSGVVREIDDQPCGTRWLLLRDERNPGGPGRLVPVQRLAGGTRGKVTSGAAGLSRSPALRPLIRAGDRIIIEQETPQVSGRLWAIALGPALAGRRFPARLEIGGWVVQALALAPGQALLKPEALP